MQRAIRIGSPRRLLGVVALALLSLGVSPAPASPVPELTAGSPPPIQVTPPAPSVRLERALDARVSAARRAARDVGVHIVDLATGDEVYARRADERYIIASNTKLFTTAAALDQLGPGYVHETPLLARGKQSGDRFIGDLAVIGAGDPNISGRHHQDDPLAIFRSWGRSLRARGIGRIDGDLYMVHGLFDDARVHPDWPRDQLTRWYEAPVESLSFNDNTVLVRVWPSSRPGAPARVELVPDLGIFEIENSARTASRRGDGVVHIDRRLGTNTFVVRGSIAPGPWPVEKWVSVDDPVQYFAAALLRGLADEGVEVAGRVYAAERLPGGLWLRMAEHRSSLLTTLEVINKRSQNFYAESVLKTLGAKTCDEGSWRGGLRAVGDFLDEAGLDTSAVELADGSGMSRGNRASPRLMTELLRHMFFHPRGGEFVDTLPTSGEEDLSWERRLAEEPYRGNVFAKTGTLSGVSTLSGYARGRSGRLYAFSILCNQTRGSWHARRAQDAILRALIDFG